MASDDNDLVRRLREARSVAVQAELEAEDAEKTARGKRRRARSYQKRYDQLMLENQDMLTPLIDLPDK